MVTTNLKCNNCKGLHHIYSGPSFKSLSVPERWNKAKELNLCRNCLCTGHNFKNVDRAPANNAVKNTAAFYNSRIHLYNH